MSLSPVHRLRAARLLQNITTRHTTTSTTTSSSPSSTPKPSTAGLIRPDASKYGQRSRSGAKAERAHVLKRLVAVAAVIGGLTVIEKLWWRDVKQPNVTLGSAINAAPTVNKNDELLRTTAVGKLCQTLPAFRVIRVRESQLLPGSSQRTTLELAAARDPGVNDASKVADRARLYIPRTATTKQLYHLLVDGIRSIIEQQTQQHLEDLTSTSQYLRDLQVLYDMDSHQSTPLTFPTEVPVLEVLRYGDGRLVVGLGDVMLHYGQSKLVSDAVMDMFARDVSR